MTKHLFKKICVLSLITAIMLTMNLCLLFASASSEDREIDIGKLNGESGSVTVRDGYPDALYNEGQWVIQVTACGYIYLGNFDLSKYEKAVINVGSSANAVFNNSSGKAYLAITSNGPVASGNKTEGITPIESAQIIGKAELTAPPGRWGSGEQIVTISLDTDYSGDVYLAYGPIVRDNNGAPVVDSLVVSKIVFKGTTNEETRLVEQWEDVPGLELASLIDFEDEDDGTDGNSMGEFNTYWGVDRGAQILVHENEKAEKYAVINSENYFQTKYLDVMEDNAYVFSFRALIGASKFCFFVRGTEPVVRENPAWKEASIGWYEKDWYTENGGAAEGAIGGTIGASGIALTKGNSNDAISLIIKTYEVDGVHIAARVVNIPVKADVVSSFHDYIIYDNGKGTIKYYIDDALFAIVDYAEPVNYDDPADDESYPFYKTVTVKNAYGDVLATVNNSRLSTEGMIAIGFRKTSGSDNYLDDLAVYFESGEQTPEPQVTEPAGTAATDATSQEATQQPGVTAAPETTDSAEIVNPTEVSTQPDPSEIPQTTATEEAVVSPNPTASPEDTHSKSGKAITVIAIIAAAIAVAAIAIVIMTKKKNRRNNNEK